MVTPELCSVDCFCQLCLGALASCLSWPTLLGLSERKPCRVRLHEVKRERPTGAIKSRVSILVCSATNPYHVTKVQWPAEREKHIFVATYRYTGRTKFRKRATMYFELNNDIRRKMRFEHIHWNIHIRSQYALILPVMRLTSEKITTKNYGISFIYKMHVWLQLKNPSFIVGNKHSLFNREESYIKNWEYYFRDILQFYKPQTFQNF